MTDILLPRPKSNEVPNFIPVSKTTLDFELQKLDWLTNTQSSQALMNDGNRLVPHNIFTAGGLEEAFLNEMSGHFGIESGLILSKTNDTTLQATGGKIFVGNQEINVPAKTFDFSSKADGFYTIVASDAGVLTIEDFVSTHKTQANVIGFVSIKNSKIDIIQNVGIRALSLALTMWKVGDATGVYAKDIGVIGYKVNQLIRSSGSIFDPHSTEKESHLVAVAPVRNAVMKPDGTLVANMEPDVNMAQIRTIHNPDGTTIDKTSSAEYLVVPIFVESNGDVILLAPQGTIQNKINITDINIKHVLNNYVFPKSLETTAAMVGVLVIRGNETSLIGPEAYYYGLSNNKNTVLKNFNNKLPATNKDNTGKLLYYDAADDSLSTKNIFESNVINDFFIKKNGKITSFTETNFKENHPILTSLDRVEFNTTNTNTRKTIKTFKNTGKVIRTNDTTFAPHGVSAGYKLASNIIGYNINDFTINVIFNVSNKKSLTNGMKTTTRCYAVVLNIIIKNCGDVLDVDELYLCFLFTRIKDEYNNILRRSTAILSSYAPTFSAINSRMHLASAYKLGRGDKITNLVGKDYESTLIIFGGI